MYAWKKHKTGTAKKLPNVHFNLDQALSFVGSGFRVVHGRKGSGLLFVVGQYAMAVREEWNMAASLEASSCLFGSVLVLETDKEANGLLGEKRRPPEHGSYWTTWHNGFEAMRLQARGDLSFYGALLYLVGKADDDDLVRLERAFPGIRYEAWTRYKTPGGDLPGELGAKEENEQESDQGRGNTLGT